MSRTGSKAALIVGGGTGIGFATAVRLAERGYALVLAGRREAVLREATERLRQIVDAAVVTAAPGDGAVEAEARRMVLAAIDAYGRLDVCVNCAGIYEPVGFTDITEPSWRRTLSATLDAQLFVSVAATRHMADAGGGRVILVSSVSDRLSEADSSHYSAAKAAVSSLARSIAVDLADRGVTANAVAPGWIHTGMVDDFARKSSRESLLRVNLLGRMGRPDEVANVIEYLAVDAPEYLTGTTLFLDGGQTAMALLP